jgi:hypothetical protein
MEGTITGVLRLVARVKESEAAHGAEQEGKKLLDEIENVRRRMDAASARFDAQNDPDLAEECIYELQALGARYRYLTRQARVMGLRKSAVGSLEKLG